MAASRKVDHTGMPAPAKEAKPVHTVRFQEGIEDHLEAKARGDRSRLYFKDGSELPTHSLSPDSVALLSFPEPYVHPPRKLLEGTAVYRCKVIRASALVNKSYFSFARSWDP